MRLKCRKCKFVFWNNPIPCVSFLLAKGGKILLIQRAKGPLKGYWCLPGGFLEYEESPKEGIKREIEEELRIKILIKQLVGVYQIDNDPNLDMELCPAHKSNSSWLLLTAFGIAFIILASGFYLFFVSSTKSAKQGFSKVNLSKLDKEEKAIYALLKEKEGSMYQSDLIKETGFSKVKMTRVLDRLTNKKIIDRNRRGMTNIIILK